MPFQKLGLHPDLLRAIRDAGYTEPTPIQTAAIPVALSGQDLTGIAQTGTGKTAAFVLPLLHRLASNAPTGPGTRALVLAPTRELVTQIHENTEAYGRHLGIATATVYGGVGETPQIRALRAGTPLVIATPGRLLDLMARGAAEFRALDALVLDEADRMLDMGFLPQIRRILAQLPKRRQTLLFSATLSKEIEQLSREFLHHPKTIEIGRRSNPAETVTQFVYEVPRHLKTSLLLHLLRDPAMNTVLVFARTKHGADRIARHLEKEGITVAALHANRSQAQRLRALRDFRSGAVRVLVATDIAARGIDVDGISHVVNYDFPPQPEDYVHRIGRTGRAQAIGDAISFVAPEEHPSLRSLERFIGRGIVRKHAADFDLTAPAPPAQDPVRPRGPQPRGNARHGSGRSSGRGTPRPAAAAESPSAKPAKKSWWRPFGNRRRQR